MRNEMKNKTLLENPVNEKNINENSQLIKGNILIL